MMDSQVLTMVWSVVVFIGLWSLMSGQPTATQRESCQNSCVDFIASDERRKISAEIYSLSEQMTDIRAAQEAGPDTTLQDCGLSWANVAEYASHKYLLGVDLMTWGAARNRCHQCGYSLAKIESRAEHDFIRRWFDATGVHRLSSTSPAGEHQIWVDGTDWGHEGCWAWTYPGVTLMSTEPDFRLWSPGQPDNYGRGEHCVELVYERGWAGNDQDCDNLDRYLCEKTPEPSVELPSMEEVRATIHCD